MMMVRWPVVVVEEAPRAMPSAKACIRSPRVVVEVDEWWCEAVVGVSGVSVWARVRLSELRDICVCKGLVDRER